MPYALSPPTLSHVFLSEQGRKTKSRGIWNYRIMVNEWWQWSLGGDTKEERIPGWGGALLLGHPNIENGSTECSHCDSVVFWITTYSLTQGYQRFRGRHCKFYPEDGGSQVMGSSEMSIRKYNTIWHHTSSDSNLPNYVRLRNQEIIRSSVQF